MYTEITTWSECSFAAGKKKTITYSCYFFVSVYFHYFCIFARVPIL